MSTIHYPTLEHVAMEARPYPTQHLKNCETGLVLFSSAFLGHNDAIHFAEAGIRTTCVDTDGERLAEMKALYPDDWTFVQEDAWTFAQETWDFWDVVSLDPFTGDTMDKVMADLPLWATLARMVLIVGSTRLLKNSEVPDRWIPQAPVVRAHNVFWLAMTK